MEKIGKILMGAMAKKAVGKAARSAMVCFYADEWGKHTFKAVSFSGGILKLSVTSSSHAMELEIQKEQLATYLKDKLNIDLRVRIIVR